MEIPKNIKIELPYNPAISLLGLSKENEHSGSKRYMQKKKKKDICTSVFTTALSTIAKIWKQLIDG